MTDEVLKDDRITITCEKNYYKKLFKCFIIVRELDGLLDTAITPPEFTEKACELITRLYDKESEDGRNEGKDKATAFAV